MVVALRRGAARGYRCAFRSPAARKATTLERPRSARPQSRSLPATVSAPAISKPISPVSWRGATGVFRTRTSSTVLGWARCFAATARSRSAKWAQHTSNAGRIYFPSGTPDLDDISGDAVDIAGSVARELEEETGLTAGRISQRAALALRVHRPAVAMIRILRVDLPGEALRARIEANLACSIARTCGIHLVRRAGDLNAAMPRFVTAFIEAQLSG